MNCDRCSELMSYAIDDVLNEEEKMDFQKHLDSCDHCKEEYLEMKNIMSMIHELPEVEVPDGFREKWTEVITEKKAPSGITHLFSNRRVRLVLGIAAVAVLVMTIPNSLPRMGSDYELASDEAVMEMAMESPEEPNIYGQDALNKGTFADEPMMDEAESMSIRSESRYNLAVIYREDLLNAFKEYLNDKEYKYKNDLENIFEVEMTKALYEEMIEWFQENGYEMLDESIREHDGMYVIEFINP